MTEARAVARYLRTSPRKCRWVIDTIRKKHIREATVQLTHLPQKAARLALKVLNSAIANAKVLKMDIARLVVSDVRADTGPQLKRFQARSMGRADRILKRTTHLSMILREEAPIKTSMAGSKEGKSKKHETPPAAQAKKSRTKKAAKAV